MAQYILAWIASDYKTAQLFEWHRESFSAKNDQQIHTFAVDRLKSFKSRGILTKCVRVYHDGILIKQCTADNDGGYTMSELIKKTKRPYLTYKKPVKKDGRVYYKIGEKYPVFNTNQIRRIEDESGKGIANVVLYDQEGVKYMLNGGNPYEDEWHFEELNIMMGIE